MNDGDNRQIPRDSLFILADLRRDGEPGHSRVKVRNLSSGGMMGEGDVRVGRGDRVTVNLRNHGWVEGSIAWVQGNRFGVAFATELDPKIVLAQVPDGSAPEPRFAGRGEARVQPPLRPVRKII